MNVLDRIKNEINLAKENADDWGTALLNDVYELCEVICNQDHSGSSVHYVKSLFNALINGEVLTPITEENANWGEGETYGRSDEITYQSKRCFGFFKTVNSETNEVTYSSNERTVVRDIDTGHLYGNGFISGLINSALPITLPYSPKREFTVFREEFSTDKDKSDLDTMRLVSITANNSKTDISFFDKMDKYYKVGKKGDWEVISESEYYERKKLKK